MVAVYTTIKTKKLLSILAASITSGFSFKIKYLAAISSKANGEPGYILEKF